MTREEEIALIALRIKNEGKNVIDVKDYKALNARLDAYLRCAKKETFGWSTRRVNPPKEFVTDFFKDMDLKLHNVRYVKPGKPLNIHHLNLIENATTIGSPTEIPVKLVDDRDKPSELQMIKPYLDEEELKKYKPTFEGIALYSTVNKDVKGLYVKEITRSQIESQQHILENYINRDVIELFMEFITNNAVDEEVVLSDIRNHLIDVNLRLSFPYDTVTFRKDALTVSKNIVSCIKAVRLYDIYINSSKEVQKEMIKNIQKVFNGYITVEDFLYEYGITEKETLENVDIKKYVKHK